jgi:hypothetical protein
MRLQQLHIKQIKTNYEVLVNLMLNNRIEKKNKKINSGQLDKLVI